MIRVLLDDLAFLQADALLRPADQDLGPATPAMSQLDKLGGGRFAEQRRVARPLEAGAAVVTGGGDLTAPYVVHVVIRDAVSQVGREVVRRALVSAWQRAGDWGLASVAAPLVGTGAGGLSAEEAAGLLIETFPRDRSAGGPSKLQVVVEREDERTMVEALLRRSV